MLMDIAQRFEDNPILVPNDLKPGIEGMHIACLLNPGVFIFQNKIWLLLRVAERPVQVPGTISFPILDSKDKIKVMSFDKSDHRLILSDKRVITYEDQNYLTTLSYVRLVCSNDGIRFFEPQGYEPIFGKGSDESF